MQNTGKVGIIALAVFLLTIPLLAACGGDGVDQDEYDQIIVQLEAAAADLAKAEAERDASRADLAEAQADRDAAQAEADAAKAELAAPQPEVEAADQEEMVIEAPEPLIGNVLGRSADSLAGRWNAMIQPVESAILGHFDVIEKNRRPETPSDWIEFSFENGLTLEVPGDWNTQDDRLFFYRGRVWYQTNFDYTSVPDRPRAFIYFGAVNYRADVFVNGESAGVHEGGFTPFNFEITKLVRDGENLLVVAVDNTVDESDIPSERTDWMNYGGITRDVRLVHLPNTFIRNYEIQLAQGTMDRISGWAQLDGNSANQSVVLSIPELGIEETVQTDEEGHAEIDIAATPELWSPESPNLYDIELRTETDSVTDQIGFRTIEVQGTEILLNGKPIFLRGISIHEDAPYGEGRAHSPQHAETLLGWAKELECNYVRLAHYTHNEHMVRTADQLGLLVWAEIPIWGDNIKFNSATLEKAKTQLSEMMARDRNRASVVFWSIGNETPVTEERNQFMSELADFVRSEDPTRLVSAALLFGEANVTPLMFNYILPAMDGKVIETWDIAIEDPLAEIVDVPALNEYLGWYYSGILCLINPSLDSHLARQTVFDNMPRVRFSIGVNKPLLISELGAGAKYGMHADQSGLAVFSEEYQALVYEKQIEMLGLQDQVRGLSPWILKDFRSEMRLYQGVQDYWNLKGLVSDDGQKKQAFYVLRDYYTTLKEEE